VDNQPNRIAHIISWPDHLRGRPLSAFEALWKRFYEVDGTVSANDLFGFITSAREASHNRNGANGQRLTKALASVSLLLKHTRLMGRRDLILRLGYWHDLVLSLSSPAILLPNIPFSSIDVNTESGIRLAKEITPPDGTWPPGIEQEDWPRAWHCWISNPILVGARHQSAISGQQYVADIRNGNKDHHSH
jgi:hypothetical protein